MKPSAARKLRAAGWRTGDAGDFLGLTREERSLVEMRLSLSASLKRTRVQQGLSQVELATRLGSSQSRVAKMESGDSSVSIDLLVRSLLALGAGAKDVARAMGGREAKAE